MTFSGSVETLPRWEAGISRNIANWIPLNVRLLAYIPVCVGSDVSLSGDRNASSSGYAKFSPPFFFDTEAGLYTGGQFLDGRASTLADQAKGPFLNPLVNGDGG